MRFTLDEILTGIHSTDKHDSHHQSASSRKPLRIITDSREAGPATIFWALRGDKHDGHRFVESALSDGADAAVVESGAIRSTHRAGSFSTEPAAEEGYLSDSRSVPSIIEVADTLSALQSLAAWNVTRHAKPVIGITGSYGKTTTREMVHAALQHKLNPHCSPRNFNNQFGVPLTLLGLNARHDAAIVELGASAHGEIARLCEIAAPEIGIITGIGQAHRGTFGDCSQVAIAKGELAAALPADGVLLLCGDDSYSRAIATRAACRVRLIGTGHECHVRSETIRQDGEFLAVRIDGVDFRVRTAGKHFARSVLFAVAAGRECGLRDKQIARGLADFRTPAGRCSVETIGEWTVIDDSYNASPETFEAACGLLGNWPDATRRLLICGDMLELGDAAAALHQDAGLAAARAGVDRIYACGQFAGDLTGAAIKAGLDPDCCEAFQELPSLLHRLQQTMRSGDVLLMKGSRGMQMERVIEWMRREVLSREPENRQRRQPQQTLPLSQTADTESAQ